MTLWNDIGVPIPSACYYYDANDTNAILVAYPSHTIVKKRVIPTGAEFQYVVFKDKEDLEKNRLANKDLDFGCCEYEVLGDEDVVYVLRGDFFKLHRAFGFVSGPTLKQLHDAAIKHIRQFHPWCEIEAADATTPLEDSTSDWTIHMQFYVEDGPPRDVGGPFQPRAAEVLGFHQSVIGEKTPLKLIVGWDEDGRPLHSDAVPDMKRRERSFSDPEADKYYESWRARHGVEGCPMGCDGGMGRIDRDGDNVFYTCFSPPRGQSIELCDVKGEAAGSGYSHFDYDCAGLRRYCCRVCIGSIPQPLFRVPTDIMLEPVNGRVPPIDDLWDRGKAFLDEKRRIIPVLRSGVNHGKTFALIDYITRHPGKRWIWAIPRDALAFATREGNRDKLDAADILYKYYSSTNKESDKDIDWHTDNIFCCAQSLMKVSGPIDLFVVDECRDCLETASELNGGVALNQFKRVCQAARRTIWLDAYGDTSLQLMAKFVGLRPVFFDTPMQPFAGKKATFIFPMRETSVYRNWAYNYVVSKAAEGERIHVVCSTKKEMWILYYKLDKQAYVIYGQQNDADRREAVRAFQRKEPRETDFKVWLSSPALTGGLNNFTVTRVIVLMGMSTLSASSMKNASHRARNAQNWDYIANYPKILDTRMLRVTSYGYTKEVTGGRSGSSRAELFWAAAHDRLGLPPQNQIDFDLCFDDDDIAEIYRLGPPRPRITTEHTAWCADEARRRARVMLDHADKAVAASRVINDTRKRKMKDLNDGCIESEFLRLHYNEYFNRGHDLLDFVIAATEAQGMDVEKRFVQISDKAAKEMDSAMKKLNVQILRDRVLKYKAFFEGPLQEYDDDKIVKLMLKNVKREEPLPNTDRDDEVVDEDERAISIELWLAQLAFGRDIVQEAFNDFDDALANYEEENTVAADKKIDQAARRLMTLVNDKKQRAFRLLSAYETINANGGDWLQRIYEFNQYFFGLYKKDDACFKMTAAIEILVALGFKDAFFKEQTEPVTGIFTKGAEDVKLKTFGAARREAEIKRRNDVWLVYQRTMGKPIEPTRYVDGIKEVLRRGCAGIGLEKDDILEGDNSKRKVVFSIMKCGLLELLGERTRNREELHRKFWSLYREQKYGSGGDWDAWGE